MEKQAELKKQWVFTSIQKAQALGLPIDPRMISMTFNLTIKDSKELIKLFNGGKQNA